MSQPQPKVDIRFEYTDGTFTSVSLGKATVLRKATDKLVFHLDRLPDGTHLMICAQEILPDGKRIECIRIMREGA